MVKRFFISTAVVALSITLRVMPTTAQLNGVPRLAAMQSQPDSQPPLAPKNPNDPAARGATSKDAPKNPPPTNPQIPASNAANTGTNKPDENMEIQRSIRDFTKWLVIVGAVIGILQVGVMSAQAFIYSQQAAMMRQTVLLTHRPHIRVRSVGITKSVNEAPMARIQLANIGASEAVKIETSIHWFSWISLPSENPSAYPAQVLIPIEKPVPPGGWTYYETLRFPATPDFVEPPWRWEPGGEEYVAGYVRYEDGEGRPRITQFCRRLNRATGRFERIADPDYDWED